MTGRFESRDWSGDLWRAYTAHLASGSPRPVKRRNEPPAPAMLVLRPGDRVLVTLTDDPGPEGCAQVAAALKNSFPDCDFTVLAGVAGLLVQPPLR